MDRAAIGLGSVMLHLRAELNFHRLFESMIGEFDEKALAKRQKAALARPRLREASARRIARRVARRIGSTLLVSTVYGELGVPSGALARPRGLAQACGSQRRIASSACRSRPPRADDRAGRARTITGPHRLTFPAVLRGMAGSRRSSACRRPDGRQSPGARAPPRCPASASLQRSTAPGDQNDRALPSPGREADSRRRLTRVVGCRGSGFCYKAAAFSGTIHDHG